MTNDDKTSLAGLFKELYADNVSNLIPNGVSLLKLLDPNYDPVIEEMFESSFPELKETLGYVPKDKG